MREYLRVLMVLGACTALVAVGGCSDDDDDDTPTDSGTGGDGGTDGSMDGSGGDGDTPDGSDDCGNGTCDEGEDETSCPADCEAAGAAFCDEQCSEDGDCVGSDGIAKGYTCGDSKCSFTCEEDVDCVRLLTSGADTDGDFLPDANCTADYAEECAEGEVCCGMGTPKCLEWGLCVAEKGEGDCFEGTAEWTVRDIADENDVTFCGSDIYTCDSGTCGTGAVEPFECDADFEGDGDSPCPTAVFPTCNDDGTCGCTTDEDSCADNTAGGTVCLADGDTSCGCAEDADCAGDSTDVCYDGTCGCGSNDACEGAFSAFEGTTQVCNGL